MGGRESSPGKSKDPASLDPLPLPGAGRAGQGGTGQISNQNSGLELFINFPGKHIHTHKATTSQIPPPYFSDQQTNEHYSFFALFQGPLSPPSHARPLFTFCSPGSGLQKAGKASPILKEPTPGRAEEDRLGEAGTGGGHRFPHQSPEAQACLTGARNCLKTCPKCLQGTSLETVRGDLKSSGWPQDATTAPPHSCLKMQHLLPKSGSHVSPTCTPSAQASAPAPLGCLMSTGHAPHVTKSQGERAVG